MSSAYNERFKRYYKKNIQDENFKEKKRHSSYKSSAKTFVNKYATLEELKELASLVQEKIEEKS
ncbi:hypothetical protein [Lactobacillus jensenii]|jgi:hypothetical protein|uniref:hypothetical protein n=1 Tax=Lactobacillus jensenii TaxID=109790 RepID=UPI001F0894DE|nr:hypothetical protein [Lactobacillus jensenii]